MAKRKVERKTGHSSDQWFKLKTKHQNKGASRRKTQKATEKERRKQGGQASKKHQKNNIKPKPKER